MPGLCLLLSTNFELVYTRKLRMIKSEILLTVDVHQIDFDAALQDLLK